MFCEPVKKIFECFSEYYIFIVISQNKETCVTLNYSTYLYVLNQEMSFDITTSIEDGLRNTINSTISTPQLFMQCHLAQPQAEL